MSLIRRVGAIQYFLFCFSGSTSTLYSCASCVGGVLDERFWMDGIATTTGFRFCRKCEGKQTVEVVAYRRTYARTLIESNETPSSQTLGYFPLRHIHCLLSSPLFSIVFGLFILSIAAMSLASRSCKIE